jgi:sortase A
MSPRARLAARIGATFCVLGLLLLAFVAYQLWGTSFYESQAQSRLRGELNRELARPGERTAPHRASSEKSRGTPPGATGATPSVQQSPQPASTPAPAEADPPVGAPVGLLTIPAIGLSDVIVEGVGAPQLEQGPGHYPGTPLPGERGNVGIAGHRTTYARPFYNLNLLQNGDPIYVLTPQGYFHYSVTGTQVVPPTDVAVLASDTQGATLTLTTCNPRYSAATRLVVTAVLTPGTAPPGGPPETKALPPTTAAQRTDPPPAGGEPLNGNDESYWPAVLWGLATLAVVVTARLVWRRMPGRFRWGAVVVGVPLAAVGLLLCFEHLSLALPASF